MLGMKICLVVSGVGLVVMAQIDEVLKVGNGLGHLGSLGIMGVVCVACIIGLVRLYKDKSKDQDRVITMIEGSTRASTESAEAIKANTNVMVEIKDAIIKCKHNQAT